MCSEFLLIARKKKAIKQRISCRCTFCVLRHLPEALKEKPSFFTNTMQCFRFHHMSFYQNHGLPMVQFKMSLFLFKVHNDNLQSLWATSFYSWKNPERMGKNNKKSESKWGSEIILKFWYICMHKVILKLQNWDVFDNNGHDRPFTDTLLAYMCITLWVSFY